MVCARLRELFLALPVDPHVFEIDPAHFRLQKQILLL